MEQIREITNYFKVLEISEGEDKKLIILAILPID